MLSHLRCGIDRGKRTGKQGKAGGVVGRSVDFFGQDMKTIQLCILRRTDDSGVFEYFAVCSTLGGCDGGNLFSKKGQK